MRRIAILGLMALLTGCSGGTDATPLALQIAAAGRESIARRTIRKQERPPLTRAALDTVEIAAMEVTVERTGVLAYIFRTEERRDSQPGRIVTWRSEDNVTLTMRNGVLIATRGLGGDVISSEVQVSGDRPGPSSGGTRVQQVRALDNKEVTVALGCELTDLGPETIEIVELRHPTRHLRETCEGEGGTVVNHYWVESRAGMVWQSRQWAGPHIGYVRLRRLTK